MRSLANVLQMIVRPLGLVQIVLGVLFWFGAARGLVNLHMFIGIVIVLILWTLAGAALVTRTAPPLAIAGIVVGLVTIWLGITQTSLLTGSAHWVIQVLHLAVGVIALGFADLLGTRVKRSGAPASA